MIRIHHLLPVAALVLAVGCTDAAKIPADAAIKAAETAVAAVRTEAAKYVPDQLKAVEDAIAGAKEQFAKGEFKAALERAKDLPARAQALAAAVAAKKQELTSAFDGVAGQLPQMLEAIKSRVDALSMAKKLPKGLDAGKLQAAKDGLASVAQAWDDASAKMKAGALSEAVAAARPLKDKAAEIMGLLGMPPPGAPAAQ